MARDGTETRDALLAAGQRLFAERGVYQVPLKAIVDAAGQRNASALHYHFGNRAGLLQAILDQHNSTIEVERATMLSGLDSSSSIRAIVEAFVLPFSRKLETAEGREFLRIVAQLVDAFDHWDIQHDRVPTQAGRALEMLGQRLGDLESQACHDRITLFLGFVADGLATHARRLTRDAEMVVQTDSFRTNLIDMSVGALAAAPGEEGRGIEGGFVAERFAPDGQFGDLSATGAGHLESGLSDDVALDFVDPAAKGVDLRRA